ncbi:MAG: MFS transporter [Prolixibacteraceae bacterium]|jgi:OFA family oxalate/formate antiporter-like MFS transporter|nr:MFS transporter [Prolixibacteraceae bacterium]
MNLKTTPFPFRVNKFPFFYGWVILFAGTVGIIMSIPGQTMGISVFTDYLIDALSIERTSLSFAYLLGTVASGLLITRAGKYYDKYGARVMAMGAGFILGLMVIGLTKVDVMIDVVSGFFIDSAHEYIAIAFLVVGFFGIRFFGQGILTMVSRNMVMKWFEKRRGFANAIMGVFVSFGFSFAPQFFNGMIENLGWRITWMQIGLFVAIVFVAFALVVFRDNAVDCGLKPDGKLIKDKNSKGTYVEKEYTLKQAKTKYSFWVFNFAMALNAFYVTALTFHVVSIFNEAGFDRETAISIFLPASFIAVSFNFIGGWISDYTKLKYLLLVNMVGILISGTALLFLENNQLSVWVLITGNGIIMGLFSVLNTVTWPRFFGTKHLGAISGYSISYSVISSALGPFLFSLSLLYFGSYFFGVLFCMVSAVVLLFFSFKADNVKALNV